MFTGLVQTTGTLHHVGGTLRVSWASQAGLRDPLTLGDSVAVNGVCLTVTALHRDGFSADVSGETLSRTNLGSTAAQGGAVNLEPALRLADRLGGHLVSGHVDGLGVVEAIEATGEAWHLHLRWQESRFGRYICDKASVSVNGISLTVAGCSRDGSRFWIAVIPHTWSHTTLRQLRCGELVNLEADQLAKYAEQLLRFSPPGPEPDREAAEEHGGSIDQAWLAQHGWG